MNLCILGQIDCNDWKQYMQKKLESKIFLHTLTTIFDEDAVLNTSL